MMPWAEGMPASFWLQATTNDGALGPWKTMWTWCGCHPNVIATLGNGPIGVGGR